MPLEIPNITGLGPEESRRVGSASLGRERHVPSFVKAMTARVEQGVDESTLSAAVSLLSRPSAGDEPLLSVPELYSKYQGIHWSEPLTERQAEWRLNVTQRRERIQGEIDRREQGITATVAGFGASMITSALFSPETYVAPLAGKLASTAMTRAVVSGAAPSRLARVGKAAVDNPLKAGFAEDAFLTAAVSEPMHMVRERLLENPNSATEYFGNVILSGALSGVLNFGASHLSNYGTDGDLFEAHSRAFVDMATGQPSPTATPAVGAMAVRESQITAAVSEWRKAEGVADPVKVIHDSKLKVVSARDAEGAIVINTARINSPVELSRALSGAKDPLPPGIDPKFHVGEQGIFYLPGKEPLGQTPQSPVPPAPGSAFNPANQPPDIVEVQKARFGQDIATDRDLDFRVVGERQIIEPWKATYGFDPQQMDPFVQPARFDPPTIGADGVAVPNPEKAKFDALPESVRQEVSMMDEIADELRILGKSASDFVKGLRTSSANEFEVPARLQQQADQIFEMVAETGYTPKGLAALSDAEIKSELVAAYKNLLMLRTQRKILQARRNAEGSSIARKGHNQVHAWLSGALRKGADNDKFGDNLYRRGETLRTSYANLVYATVDRLGIRRHLDKYDRESQVFWSEVEKARQGLPVQDANAKALADTLGEIREHARTLLNRQGAGIRQKDGYFLRTTHNRTKLGANREAWFAMMMDDNVVDWQTMIADPMDMAARRDYLRETYHNIMTDPDAQIDTDISGGKKGAKFAKRRVIQFQPGAQTKYNDAFGNAHTARALLDQIELQARAVAITEKFGPDFKEFYKSLQEGLSLSGASDRQKERVRWHFDQLTGELDMPASQDLARYTQEVQNYNNAIYLHGTGITTSLTDPSAQIINLRTRGLSKSIGSAAKAVMENTRAGWRAARGKNLSENERKIRLSLLVADTNLMGLQKATGDAGFDPGAANSLGRRLSLFTIKYGGTSFAAKAAQFSTVIGDQRALARALSEAETDVDLAFHLRRHGVSEAEFRSLAPYVIKDEVSGFDQLSAFDIEDPVLRAKMQNFLHEGMQVGSLQADPMQSADAKFGTKAGTWKGSGVRLATQYLASTLAVQEKLLMRLAVMGGGDARFMSLVRRSHFAETITAMGAMLASATAVVVAKDALRNKEPFFLGDQPLDFDTMHRIVKISGIIPLGTEFMDTLSGGITGQLLRQIYRTADSAMSDDSPWSTLYEARRMSPFIATTVGPVPAMLDAMIGLASEDYAREIARRQRSIEASSGQAPIF